METDKTNSLRDKVMDALNKYVGEELSFCDTEETACDIADIIFQALGISPEQSRINGEKIKVEPPHIPEPFWLENNVTCQATFGADEDMVEVYVGGYYLGSVKAKGISSEAQKEIGLHFM